MHEHAQLFKVLRTQIDVVLDQGTGVLNADDALLADMAELCDGSVLLYTTNPEHPAVQAHRARDGRALIGLPEHIQIFQGQQPAGRVPLQGAAAQRVLATLQERHGLNADDARRALMAAVGAAWSLGVAPELVNAGLETFATTLPA